MTKYTTVITLLVAIGIISIGSIFVQKETFLEFIHIPKNAGTTIENIANEKNIKWGRMKPDHRDHVKENKCDYWHIPPKEFDRTSHYYRDPDGTFCVIRNPYDRMVSEYKYRNKDSNDAVHMNKWIKKHLTPEHTQDGKLNCHFIPQYNYVYDDLGQKTCDHVLQFDNLADNFNKLTNQYNVDLTMDPNRRDNRSSESLTQKDLSQENIELIKVIYHNDFSL